MTLALGLVGLAAGFFLGGCSRLPEVTMPWTESPREQYAQSLEEAGLAATALGQAWLAAGRRALVRPVEVQPPYRETVFFDPSEPTAAGFRLELRRGQELKARVSAEAEARGRFLDLYGEPRTSDDEPRLLESAEEGVLSYTVRDDGSYLVRLQPELLQGGRFVLTIEAEPALVFPVEGHDSTAIRSFFGDPRDGGARRHQGVDIFAPRGTAAVAAADGRVTRVGTNRLGGKTVWLFAENLGLSLYYAHLDRQDVRPGQKVRAGESVGRVGNTGNASRTASHLHFSVHDTGALDPWPFLYRPPGDPPELTLDPALLGRWSRVARNGSRLRSAPRSDAGLIEELPRGTPLHALAGSGDWLRVRVPDGRYGYMAAGLTEPIDRPLRRVRWESSGLLRYTPSPVAPAIGEVLAGEEISVLAETTLRGTALRDTVDDAETETPVFYAESTSGRRGWIVGSPS